jgi:hypothetical protein
VNIVFSNLDIIPNSGITVLVKYGINREKMGIGFAKLFYAKNEVIFFETPCVFDAGWLALKHIDA